MMCVTVTRVGSVSYDITVWVSPGPGSSRRRCCSAAELVSAASAVTVQSPAPDGGRARICNS